MPNEASGPESAASFLTNAACGEIVCYWVYGYACADDEYAEVDAEIDKELTISWILDQFGDDICDNGVDIDEEFEHDVELLFDVADDFLTSDDDVETKTYFVSLCKIWIMIRPGTPLPPIPDSDPLDVFMDWLLGDLF